MSLIVNPLLLPTSASERISSSMLASFGSSVSACCRRRSRISFSCLNCARLFAIDCFWISSSSSWRNAPCWRATCCWIGSTSMYQLPTVMSPTMTPRPATLCASGALVMVLRTSCPLSATVSSSDRVVGDAGDLPLDRPAVVLLRRLLDRDVGEVLGRLQLLREGGEVLVRHGRPVQHQVAALLRVLVDPDLVGDDRRELVHDLDRPGARLLERIEDLELVLERLLVLRDRLHFADRLFQLRDLVARGDDALVERIQVVVLRLPPQVVADSRAHQDQGEEDQLLAAEFALLGGADREEVDPNHRRLPLALVRPAQREADRHCGGGCDVHDVLRLESPVVDLDALERIQDLDGNADALLDHLEECRDLGRAAGEVEPGDVRVRRARRIEVERPLDLAGHLLGDALDDALDL